MARQRDDDLGPALLALGALALGIVAIVTLWGLRGPASAGALDARGEHEARSVDDGAGGAGPGWASSTYSDAGVGGGASGWAGWTGFTATDRLEPEEEADPQVLAMRRSFARGGDAGMSGFSPYRGTGRATRVEGIPGVAADATCDLRVLPVSTGGSSFNCVVRVRCGGVVVYPDGALEAGYAPCEIERGVPRLATDHAPTARDGDPELLVDLDARVARVRDLRREERSLVEIRLD